MNRPDGDPKGQEEEIKTDQSDASINVFENNADDDFQLFNRLLREPEDLWEHLSSFENLTVFKKRDIEGTNIMIRCQAILPRIPKQVAYRAYADVKLRKKWDQMMQNLEIVENDEEKGTSILYYQIKTPPFIQTRDALILKKTLKDYPHEGQWSIVLKSVTHPNYPENPKKFVRTELTIFGFVFEDDTETMGTKMSWVMQNDIKGSVPKSLINSRMAKNPKIMIENLTKACQKIIAGSI